MVKRTVMKRERTELLVCAAQSASEMMLTSNTIMKMILMLIVRLIIGMMIIKGRVQKNKLGKSMVFCQTPRGPSTLLYNAVPYFSVI